MSDLVTRESELTRVLGRLAEDLPDPAWVTLVDHEGLVVACVPQEPPIPADRVAAMTAGLLPWARRVLEEIEGQDLRYASVAGSGRHLLAVVLGENRIVSIGLPSDVPAHKAFHPLRKWVPELNRVLERRFTEASH
jgi:predicted regulator of Ras-like GTPase activity (Roadblock/LC7/MglB family)